MPLTLKVTDPGLVQPKIPRGTVNGHSPLVQVASEMSVLLPAEASCELSWLPQPATVRATMQAPKTGLTFDDKLKRGFRITILCRCAHAMGYTEIHDPLLTASAESSSEWLVQRQIVCPSSGMGPEGPDARWGPYCPWIDLAPAIVDITTRWRQIRTARER